MSKLSKISGIYKITSPSNKVYIGQSVHLYGRIKSYYEPNSAPNQVILKRSFSKYGVDNHVFEALEECTVERLNDRERYWQDFYKEVLLNCRITKSSDKSGYCSDETKNNISRALKNTDASYKHLKIPVFQYSLDGNLIKEWESVREASRELGIDCSAIVKAISPKYPNKTANRFIWSYTKKPVTPVLKN